MVTFYSVDSIQVAGDVAPDIFFISASLQTVKSAKSIKGGRLDLMENSGSSEMSSLPSFHMLKTILARTFTLVPTFLPEKETLFLGLDEESEQIDAKRLNYTWDGKSKLAVFSARYYSDGTITEDDFISMQVASNPFVKCKVCINQQIWDEKGHFSCHFSLKTRYAGRDCLNDNFSAVFVAQKTLVPRLEPVLVFIGNQSLNHLQGLTDSAEKFTDWLNSV